MDTRACFRKCQKGKWYWILEDSRVILYLVINKYASIIKNDWLIDCESIFNRINYNKDRRIVKPLKSKRIGKIDYDTLIAVSNPCYGNKLRIIGTENSGKENCQIVVCFDMSD